MSKIVVENWVHIQFVPWILSVFPGSLQYPDPVSDWRRQCPLPVLPVTERKQWCHSSRVQPESGFWYRQLVQGTVHSFSSIWLMHMWYNRSTVFIVHWTDYALTCIWLFLAKGPRCWWWLPLPNSHGHRGHHCQEEPVCPTVPEHLYQSDH